MGRREREMAKLFWDHLISVKDIQIYIKDQDLKEEEKLRLIDVAYQTFNIRILDLVLTALPEKKHQSFLDRFAKKPSDEKIIESVLSIVMMNPLEEDRSRSQDQLAEIINQQIR